MTAAAQRANRLLAFRAGGAGFAIPAQQVREVLAAPPLTPVPQSPASLLGLGNVRGEPVPVVSAAVLLGRSDGAAKRLIVIEGEHPAALAIDRIDGLVDEQAGYEMPAFAELLDVAFPARAARTAGSAQGAQRASQAEERLALLRFVVCGQSFALPLDEVEAVLRPDRISPVPRADAATVGTTEWRGLTLPLFSLAVLLGLSGEAGDSARGIVVARLGDNYFGLMVDRIDTVIRPAANSVDPVPAALLRDGSEAVIRAVHRPGGGAPLISVLAVERLFREEITARLGTAAKSRQAAAPSAQVSEELLLIESGGHRLAFPLDAVHHVARLPDVTAPVPGTPPFIVGLINHRGEAVPVVDLALHLTARAARGPKQRLLIVSIAGAEAALLVDAIEKIVRVPAAALAAAPPLGDARTDQFGRTIVLGDGAAARLVLSPLELFDEVRAALIGQAVSARSA